MYSISTLILLLGGVASLPATRAKFVSRPELVVPKLNITVPAGNGTEKGLLFVAPYYGFGNGGAGAVQEGAYIFKDDGELVWSSLGHYSGFVGNFRPDVWDGKVYLRAFQSTLSNTPGRSYGRHNLLGNDYRVAKEVQAQSDKLPSLHEFTIVDGKTALIEIAVLKSLSLRPWGGSDGQNWIQSSGFQEVDIDTGKVLFEWQSLDHVDPNDSVEPLASNPLQDVGRTPSSAWDYFHLNSIDKDDEGNYLISARHTSTIYKINGTDGNIIWKLSSNANTSSFRLDDEGGFAWQHDARLHGRLPNGGEIVSLFDNGASSNKEFERSYSRVLILELNHSQGTAKVVKTLNAPDGVSAHSQGNAQVLPNGNVFANWGDAGAITEFSSEGKVVFHSYLDSTTPGLTLQNYRGFRANWTGIPSEVPAIAVLGQTAQDLLDVYVSWNGDTETVFWRFYAKDQNQGARFIKTVQRQGFETHATLNVASLQSTQPLEILAEAVGSNGQVLGRTLGVSVSFKVTSGDVQADEL